MSPAGRSFPAASILFNPVPLYAGFTIKSSDVRFVTDTEQVLGNAAARLSVNVILLRLTSPKFSRLNSKVTFALPSGRSTVSTVRLAIPMTGFSVNSKLVGSSLLVGSPSPSGSGLDPLCESSETGSPVGVRASAVAVLLKAPSVVHGPTTTVMQISPECQL